MKKKYNSRLKYYPIRLNEIKLTCPKCDNIFSPKWLDDVYDYNPNDPIGPYSPVKPDNYDGPGRWIPIGGQVNCTREGCDGFSMLEYPIKDKLGDCDFYGDEALREYRNNLLYTYTLIGGDRRIIPAVEDSIRKLKISVCPNLDPDTWRFHMKELWSGDNRKKHPVYKDWNKDKVNWIVNEIFSIVRENELLANYNIALCIRNVKPKHRKYISNWLKYEAYILLVLQIVDDATDAGLRPFIFFDAEKPVKTGKVIQQWARDYFYGSQWSLAYPFITKGMDIPEPQFLPPASEPILELADFVSYLVARHYDQRWKGKVLEDELSIHKLGRSVYMTINNDDNIFGPIFYYCRRYPF